MIVSNSEFSTGHLIFYGSDLLSADLFASGNIAFLYYHLLRILFGDPMMYF